jgi:ubiquinone/menaquinone biosynthesis C-methylase UbiE
MRAETRYLAVDPIAVPRYLEENYWWAYIHPLGVKLFEREWLVDMILWGNLRPLRDAALDALGERLDGRTLQIACVYGDLTPRLASRVANGGRLDVLDVLPIQLDNLARKLPCNAPVELVHGDSAALPLESASYDRALLFFLLHEQPDEVRRKTIAEALRVVKPGGRLVIIDYHRPSAFHPLYWPMVGILRTLEPFALDLWRHEICEWFPKTPKFSSLQKTTSFGGLYQLLTLTL